MARVTFRLVFSWPKLSKVLEEGGEAALGREGLEEGEEAEAEERELVSLEPESRVISSSKLIKNKVVGSKANLEMLIPWISTLDMVEELENLMRRKEELAEEIGERNLIVLTKEDILMRDFQMQLFQPNLEAQPKQLLMSHPRLRRIRRPKRLLKKSFLVLIWMTSWLQDKQEKKPRQEMLRASKVLMLSKVTNKRVKRLPLCRSKTLTN